MGLRGEVDDRLAADAGCPDGFGRHDIALDRLANSGKISAFGRIGQLVEDHDLVPRGKKALDEVTTDEAATAGDEHAHRSGC